MAGAIVTLILETPRLILRPPVQDDFAAWAVFSGDAEAMQFIGGAGQPDASWRGIATMAGS